MQKKCKICIKNHEIIVVLRQTKTAELIWKSLPFNCEVNTWGSEIYFFVPPKCSLEENSKDVMNFGEIAYWPSGKAIAIGFGKTPVSINDEIRLADKCNVWGDTDYDSKKLNNITDGEKVEVSRC